MSASSYFRSKQEHCGVLQNFPRVLNGFPHFCVLVGEQHVMLQTILTFAGKKRCPTNLM